jgi:hypothetical protein
VTKTSVTRLAKAVPLMAMNGGHFRVFSRSFRFERTPTSLNTDEDPMAKIRTHFLSLGIAALAGPTQVHAYMSPEPLPRGVRAFAWVYGQAAGIDSRLTEDGLLQALSHPLNRSVSLEELAEAEPDLLKLKSVLNDLDPKWADQLLGVNLYADVSVFESRKVTGFMYGITDRFSLGVMIPFIERDMKFGFRADVTNNAGAIASGVGDIPALQEGLARLKNYPLNTQTFTKAIFLDRGYNAPTSSHVETWGDVEVESRYTYFIGDRWGLGLRSGFRVPTSSYRPDIRNILDQDLTEDTWALKASHLSEFQIVPRVFSWSTTVGGIVRLPKKQTRAYALSSDEVLPDLNDPNQIESVRKTIGPELNAESGLQLSLFQGLFNVMGSYFYSVKGQDKIKGVRNLDYARETSGTAAETQGYELSLEMSTFSAFRRNSFFIPLKISTAYVRPIAGRNTIFAPYWRFDSVVLF